MHEIIFRGKRICDDKWTYGSLIKFNKQDVIFSYEGESEGAYDVYRNTVGQYTGTTDKSGVKIFEGDILRTKYGRICIVKWFAPQACFDLIPIETKENIDIKAPDLFDLWYSENLCVIGNIYDNVNQSI